MTVLNKDILFSSKAKYQADFKKSLNNLETKTVPVSTMELVQAMENLNKIDKQLIEQSIYQEYFLWKPKKKLSNSEYMKWYQQLWQDLKMEIPLAEQY